MYTNLSNGHLGTSDAAAQYTDRCDAPPTLYIVARPRVGLIPLSYKADGYMFQRSLCLHTKQVVCIDK